MITLWPLLCFSNQLNLISFGVLFQKPFLFYLFHSICNKEWVKQGSSQKVVSLSDRLICSQVLVCKKMGTCQQSHSKPKHLGFECLLDLCCPLMFLLYNMKSRQFYFIIICSPPRNLWLLNSNTTFNVKWLLVTSVFFFLLFCRVIPRTLMTVEVHKQRSLHLKHIPFAMDECLLNL